VLLVTGASGLLGASLILCARDRGIEVCGIYYRHPVLFSGAEMLNVDLHNFAATRDALIKLKPNRIVHCAAATNVDWCESHYIEAERINAEASRVLAQVAQEIGARFMYISTDAVFDGRKGNYSELDMPAPINTYGKSKLNGEQKVLKEHSRALIVRVNIYGWNVQDKFSLAEWILQELGKNKHVPGFTNIHFTPMLVNDLAQVLLAMLDADLDGIYHVAGSETISKYDFARQIAVQFGFDPSRVVPVSSNDANLRAPRPSDISLNIQKISAILGRSLPNVKAGLQKFQALHEIGYPQQLKRYACGTAL
jgi:dTDP-4-dehydrorhamnose reductase